MELTICGNTEPDKFRFITANDEPDRDPVQWTIKKCGNLSSACSDTVNGSWETVSEQNVDASIPTERFNASEWISWGVNTAPDVSAVGDPHLQNVHGERFDLMKPGKHVLINIPRGERAEDALLRVQADADHMGEACADMYFQTINITGIWAEAKRTGGYRHAASERFVTAPGWLAFNEVELKVVHGHTISGTKYLNLYAKHLGRTGLTIGGLLGEDDHADVATPSDSCAQRMALTSARKTRGEVDTAAVSVATARYL